MSGLDAAAYHAERARRLRETLTNVRDILDGPSGSESYVRGQVIRMIEDTLDEDAKPTITRIPPRDDA